ncbi:MAG: ribonuclease HI [Deltaproteobacteria bacterium]|nr:ribonuclease HI [Deltaproteobacteria bacterium]
MTTTHKPDGDASSTTSAPAVVVFCDGSCLGNPGPGGWAALMQTTTKAGPAEKMLTGHAADTTNNRMELQAALEALRALTRRCAVDVHTDSNYVVQGMKSWIHGWKKKGWKNSAGKPVENQDLWLALDEAAARHAVRWHWVRGHNGHPENERVDVAARDAATRGRARAR